MKRTQKIIAILGMFMMTGVVNAQLEENKEGYGEKATTCEEQVKNNPEFLIGLSEAELKKLIEKGVMIRVVGKDGMPYMVTKDFRVERYNVELQEGVVKTVYCG